MIKERLHANKNHLRETVKQVKEGVMLWELVLLFAVVPIVLLAVEGVIRSNVWVLGDYNRAYFRFPLTTKTFWTPAVLWKAFISSYAHDSLQPHLTGTLFMYVVSMTALYPLAILADRKQEFHLIVAFGLLMTPFIISYQSLQNPMGRTTIGFSGVDAAFLGTIPVLLFAAVREQTDIEFIPLWSVGPFFFLLAGLAFIAGTSLTTIVLSVGVGLVVSVLTVVYLGVDDLIEGLHYMTWPSNPFNWWAVTAAIAGPYLLFFSISPQTNIVGHLAGYIFGYLFALLLRWDVPQITYESLSIRSE